MSTDLEKKISEHRAWLDGSGGKRADFAGMDLRHTCFARTNLDGANFADADLRYANFSHASLRGAHLRGANLQFACFSFANLYGANLQWANLSYVSLHSTALQRVNLRFTNLSLAHLCQANLKFADLSFADLTSTLADGANFKFADLSFAKLDDLLWDGANFLDADLSGTQLDQFGAIDTEDEFLAIIATAPEVVPQLLELFETGKIDGSKYLGESSCLIGSIAKLKGVPTEDLPEIHLDVDGLTERLVAHIRPGDTPDNSPFVAVCCHWLRQFNANNTPP